MNAQYRLTFTNKALCGTLREVHCQPGLTPCSHAFRTTLGVIPGQGRAHLRSTRVWKKVWVVSILIP